MRQSSKSSGWPYVKLPLTELSAERHALGPHIDPKRGGSVWNWRTWRYHQQLPNPWHVDDGELWGPLEQQQRTPGLRETIGEHARPSRRHDD